MPALPTPVLPKRVPHGPHPPSSAMQVSPLLLEAAGSEPEAVLQKLHISKAGLSAAEAEQRLQHYGPNVIAREASHSHIRLLGKALINPLVILLLVIAASSFLTPLCSHSAFAPTLTASFAIAGVNSARRKTSTMSIGSGTSASVGYARSPRTSVSFGFTGITR